MNFLPRSIKSFCMPCSPISSDLSGARVVPTLESLWYFNGYATRLVIFLWPLKDLISAWWSPSPNTWPSYSRYFPSIQHDLAPLNQLSYSKHCSTLKHRGSSLLPYVGVYTMVFGLKSAQQSSYVIVPALSSGFSAFRVAA